MTKISSEFVAWILVVAAGINTTFGNLFLKRSRLGISDYGLWNLLFSPWFILGISFYALNVILFAKSLEKLPVSAAYPVLAGIGFGLIVLLGNYLFGEQLTYTQLSGIAFIFLGIVLVTS